MVKVIAFDPGGTTGWASFSVPHADNQFSISGVRWNCGYLGPQEHHADLEALLELEITDQDTHVVCESFEFRQFRGDAQRHKIELISCEYIGIIKLVAERFDRQVTLKMQTAAVGKGFDRTGEKLVNLGIYQTPITRYPNRHINDAAKHLVKYLCADLKIKPIIYAVTRR